MAEQQHSQLSSLRALELHLLRCSLPPSNPPPPPHQPLSTPYLSHLHTLIEQILELIESGEYTKALSSDAAKSIFSAQPLIHNQLNDSSEKAELFYSEYVPQSVALFLNKEDGVEKDSVFNSFLNKLYKTVLVMAVAVAALLAFIQSNITGPMMKLPPMPLGAITFGEEELTKGFSGWLEWEGWAQKELMSAGSDLRAKFLNLQYIIFAKILLMRTKDILSEGNNSGMDGARSISWWLARLLIIQQKLLDDRSSTLFDLLQVFTRESLHHIGSVEKEKDYWASLISEEDVLTIVSMLNLEAGIMELIYGRVDASRVHIESAAATSRLSFSISGALGFRTVHQALEAVTKVLDMTNKKRIDIELLERMLQELELRTSTRDSELHALRDSVGSAEAGSNMINADTSTSLDVDLARDRGTEYLIQSVGKILRQIVQTGGNAEIWDVYARWHKLKGDLAMCSEALLKQVRSYQGSDLWKDIDRFSKFARASLELCKVYQEIARRNGSRRELSAAEMHLKSTIKQAEAFSDTKEYQDILACFDEVKAAQTSSIAVA